MKRAGDIFSAIFDRGMMQKAEGYSAFFSCWKDLVEKNGIPAAAAHSWISSLDRGLVWIEVDHPGWKQILQTKESKLLSDFRYRFPELDISGISILLCRPGSSPIEHQEPPLPTGGKDTAEIAIQEENLPQVEAMVGYETIKDPALKEVLRRLEQSIVERELKNGNQP